MNTTVRAMALVGLLAFGCNKPDPPEPPEVSNLQRLGDAEIEEMAGSKLNGIGVATIERGQLLDKLRRLQTDEEFKARSARFGIQAVAAFELGEGGAVVKYARGAGRIQFAGGREDAALGLEAYSFGAVIGGSATQGVILFLGLQDEAATNGTYVGSVTRATAATAETEDATILVHETNGHYAYLVTVGQGLTADAGKSKLTLSVR